jgi:hypothetical protein
MYNMGNINSFDSASLVHPCPIFSPPLWDGKASERIWEVLMGERCRGKREEGRKEMEEGSEKRLQGFTREIAPALGEFIPG